MNDKLEYKSIKEVLSKMSERINISTGKNRPTLYSVWEKIVGSRLFLNCKLYDINENTIIIIVNHPGVAQQIKLKTKQIIRNISKYYPELKIEKIKTKLETQYEIKKTQPKLNENQVEDKIKKTIPIEIKENLPDEFKKIFKTMRKNIKK